MNGIVLAGAIGPVPSDGSGGAKGAEGPGSAEKVAGELHPTPSGSPPGVEAAISPWGDSMHRLWHLRQQDPARFAHVMQHVGAALRQTLPPGDPGLATPDDALRTLGRLAAGQTQPPSAPPPHRHPRASDAAAMKSALAYLRAELDPPVGDARDSDDGGGP